MDKKHCRRALRVAGKASQVFVKLTLIRCFGIDGAACVLAGVAAASARVRTANPTLAKVAGAIGRSARNVLAMTTNRIINKLLQKSVDG